MDTRPKRTPEIEDEIVARLSDGEPLRAICRDERMPHWTAVYDWIKNTPEFALRIAQARELGFDAIAEESLLLLEEPPERCPAGLAGDKVDPGHVQWQKNRAEQRLKLLAKWSPKKYGDKQEITHRVEEDTTARLLAARTRTGG